MGENEANAREGPERALRALLIQGAALYRVAMEETHLRAYAASLAQFSLEVVRDALMEAQRVYPDWFATAPQLHAIATRLQRARTPRQPQKRLDQPDRLRGVLPEDNPYEQLARRWERSPPRKREGTQWLKQQTSG